MLQKLKVCLEFCTLGLTLGLLIFFVGCSGSSDSATPPVTPPVPTPVPTPVPPPVCSTFDCRSAKFNLETAKYNLVTANLDGTDLKVIIKGSYREMTHPRITSDRQWIAFTRHNQLNPNNNGCAEVKQDTATVKYNYANTEIRAINMDSSVEIALTTPSSNRVSTNNYWIDNTFNFTFLDGPVIATQTDKIQIKRAYRNSNMAETLPTSAVAVPDTIFAVDPQQLGNKIVFAGIWDITNPDADLMSIFTLDLATSSTVGRTIAMGYKGTLPASAVIVGQANENDPKFSPDGSKIAFMRKVETTLPLFYNKQAYDHGFHIFVTSVSGVPGSEIDISDKYLLPAQKQSLFYNDGVPEWIDEDTLVFFTLNFPNLVLEQKLYTMKINGSQRTEISLPAGYYYSDPIAYKDAGGKTRILFAANKSSATCK